METKEIILLVISLSLMVAEVIIIIDNIIMSDKSFFDNYVIVFESEDEVESEYNPKEPILRKCLIQRYDPEVTEAPFEFITLGEMEVFEELAKPGHSNFYNVLYSACLQHGYRFKFYSMAFDDSEFYYHVIVH